MAEFDDIVAAALTLAMDDYEAHEADRRDKQQIATERLRKRDAAERLSRALDDVATREGATLPSNVKTRFNQLFPPGLQGR